MQGILDMSDMRHPWNTIRARTAEDVGYGVPSPFCALMPTGSDVPGPAQHAGLWRAL